MLNSVSSEVRRNDDSHMYELFHSGVSLNCKIFTFIDPITKTENEHYWLTKGPTLEIYNSKKILIRSIDVFPLRELKIKISGIRLTEDNEKVVIWGRSTFITLDIMSDLYDIKAPLLEDLDLLEKNVYIPYDSITTTNGKSNIIFKQSILNLEKRINTIGNWITDALYEGERVYLLTSCNEVIIWDDYLNVLKQKVQLQNIKSISYKGSLKLRNNIIIVISPTIIAGCHIWTINIEENDYKTNLLYTLSENVHHGIIFDSQIDNDFKHLITCSDDRSINLYNFETGELIAKIYGHQARIWSLKFVYNDVKDLFGIISCSEDCNFILWKFSNDYKQLHKHSIHEVTQIKNCWSFDYKNDKVLTCGNDGRVKITNVFVNKIDESVISLDLSFAKKEFLKEMIKYKDYFVALTNTGTLYSIDSNGKYNIFKLESNMTSQLVKLVSANEENFFFAIDKENIIYFLNLENGKPKLKLKIDNGEANKILFLQVALIKSDNIYFVVDSPNRNGSFLLYSVNLKTKSYQIVNSYLKIQPNLKQPVTVTSCILSLDLSELIIGTINGKILVFKNDNITNFKAISFDSHNEPIVAMKFTQETYNAKKLFLAASKTHYSLMTEDLPILTNNSSIKIERADYNEEEGIILYGIRDNHYIKQIEKKNFIKDQFDLKQYSQIFKNNTGWCGVITKTENNTFSINIKNFDNTLEHDCLVHEGTHGREVRSVTCVDYNKDNFELIFITGSEDTTIKLYNVKINQIDNDMSIPDTTCLHYHKQGRLKYEPLIPSQQMTFREHVSGIQTTGMIKCGNALNNKKYLITTSAKEELFFWKCYTIDQGSKKLSILGKLPTTKHLQNKEVTAELRITSFAYDPKHELLFTCYSNSMIRSWKLMETQDEKIECTLVEETFYKNCSIFDCMIVQDMLVISSSEGHLTSYFINEDLSLKLNDTILIHQSGIMTIDILGDCNIIAGGDDNSISLTEIDENKKFVFKNKIVNAANSAITNIKTLNETQFIAVSTDQLVSIFGIDKLKHLSLQRTNEGSIKQELTNVADTQTIDTFDKFCLIGGLGLSIWELPTNLIL
ncbi:hypothetical protein ACO0SA_001168 [Hanseniaspora valbyensis]